MKKIILAIVILCFPVSAFAATKHGDLQYNCAITKKPATPEYLTYRWKAKHDRFNNGKVKLIWEDSDRAHKVEIQYKQKGKKKWQKKTTDDNASAWIKGLTNSKDYKFRVRGISNCGKSGWSDTLTARP